MLEYTKTILKKVSFDRNLFEKELIKSIKLLVANELKEFKAWCYDQFGHIYSAVLNKHLSNI